MHVFALQRGYRLYHRHRRERRAQDILCGGRATSNRDCDNEKNGPRGGQVGDSIMIHVLISAHQDGFILKPFEMK